MPITISRKQRDALYEEMINDLSGIGGIYDAIAEHDYDTARRFRCEFVAEMRLLDDLGWATEDPGEGYELTMILKNSVVARAHAASSWRRSLPHT